jgi:hypothetical protein
MTLADDTQTTIATLRSAYDQWKRDVSFRSTYHLRKGRAKSVELGLRNGADGGLEVDYKATGRFIKKKDTWVRYSMDHGGPALELEPGRAAEIKKLIGMAHPNKSATQQRKNKPRSRLGSWDMFSNLCCVGSFNCAFVRAW